MEGVKTDTSNNKLCVLKCLLFKAVVKERGFTNLSLKSESSLFIIYSFHFKLVLTIINWDAFPPSFHSHLERLVLNDNVSIYNFCTCIYYVFLPFGFICETSYVVDPQILHGHVRHLNIRYSLLFYHYPSLLLMRTKEINQAHCLSITKILHEFK